MRCQKAVVMIKHYLCKVPSYPQSNQEKPKSRLFICAAQAEQLSKLLPLPHQTHQHHLSVYHFLDSEA